ncbi:GDSL esterase/lipase At3g48460 [Nicotiana tabacum]|uniref:GDSL esterase/lipase At3g48460 n=1 Tax=Nicotiana tabacum TaxID=4097 RepID=A0A1S3Y2Y6_TOBAC|nr:GDSL esterase/lipase At3g48460 [Nicotiana tomentosiformis]XP_016446495.1 PREDICTED: GDSL esterase/lipase At3g48460-like [Nicotiana tabacum]
MAFFCRIVIHWKITLIIFTITLIFSPPLSSAASTPKKFKKIYAFGDSYTDTGNTHSATGPSSFNYVSNPPYGRTFFHHPTNRYSDGRLVIDFVAESLSLPFLPPYRNPKADKTYGVNFAVAGSTAIRHRFFVRNNLTLNVTPQSLQTQLTWFNRFLESQGCKNSTTTPKQCEAVFSDALFWVGEIGANDYAYSFGSSVSPNTIQHLATTSVTGFLQVLLNKGAKYVVVQGLPPTGCLTLSMYLAPETDRDDMGCVGSVDKQSNLHNSIIQTKLDSFRKQFPQAVIIYADYWNAYSTVVKGANKYGFKELFKSCCGSGGGNYNFDVFNTCGSPSASSCPDPSQYINWDGVHLTEAMYKTMANLFLNGTFCKPSFSYLLAKKQ